MSHHTITFFFSTKTRHEPPPAFFFRLSVVEWEQVSNAKPVAKSIITAPPRDAKQTNHQCATNLMQQGGIVKLFR